MSSYKTEYLELRINFKVWQVEVSELWSLILGGLIVVM